MSKHLVIAAAGTGGHVMPGVAVAKILFPAGGPSPGSAPNREWSAAL